VAEIKIKNITVRCTFLNNAAIAATNFIAALPLHNLAA